MTLSHTIESAIAAFVAAKPSSDPLAVLDELTAAKLAAVNNRDLMRQIFTTLAEQPERRDEASTLVNALLVDRERLAHHLGSRLLTWLILGGTVTFDLPGCTPEKVPAPAPPRLLLEVVADAAPPAPVTAPVAVAEPVRVTPRPISTPPPALGPTGPAIPPKAPVEEPEPSGVRKVVSIKSISAFTNLFNDKVGGRVTAPVSLTLARERQTLRQLLDMLGPLPTITTAEGEGEELDRLESVTTKDMVACWYTLDKVRARLWVLYAVARTRALKGTRHRPLLNRMDHRDRVKAFICEFPAFTRVHLAGQGHLNGLQGQHNPQRGTWMEDAAFYLSELEAWLGEDVAFVAPEDEPEEPDDALTAEPHFLSTWPYASRVIGRHAAIVGGEAREGIRALIQERFGFASLDWVSIDQMRRVQALSTSLANGKTDLVIFLNRWMSHKAGDIVLAGCKAGNVDCCYAKGSGVGAVRVALETFFEGQATGAKASVG